jgi:PPK2 family polyphosphate:nucleotide phosphotransferase
VDERVQFINRLVAPLRVKPGRVIDLARDFDPAYKDKSVTRGDSGSLLARGIEILAEYQDRLSAQASAGVLLVLQGHDAAGKDSTIKHVMRGINPQGVDVHSFSRPSTKELRHDFLWRCQQVLPERGRIGVFNRSHYEEVLIVRVHPEYLDAQGLPALPDDGIWERRYRAINDWEHYLVENGIRVVKVFLNLSQREQAKRLLRRIDNPRKHWKFEAADIHERRHWDDYQEAYSAMLTHTSTEWAPWHVVPADRKWFARLATAAVLTQVLVDLDPRYPQVKQSDLKYLEEARAELVAELSHHKREGAPSESPRGHALRSKR